MTKNRKTVFLGPFIGEFGWELLFWHGWVKRLCRTRYKDYHKIACSFPGRYPLYPDVDEFWPLPEKFLKNPISSRGYIADNWTKGYPKPDKKPFNLPELSPLVNEVIRDFKKKLSRDAEFTIPWALRYDKDDKRYYGCYIPENPKSDKDFVAYGIPFSNQSLEGLQPTPKGIKLLRKMVGPKEKMVAIFPRCRVFRRPDKNWTKQNYETLISSVLELSRYKIAIFGEPGGAFFADGVPDGCIDLIRVDPNHRLDVQIAALKQSVMAVGSQSGGTHFSLAAGCPTLTWGETIAYRGFEKANYTHTKLIFYPSANPSVNVISEYVKWMLGRGELSHKHEIKRATSIILSYVVPDFLTKSIKLSKMKKLVES
jgi:hypothetical protein